MAGTFSVKRIDHGWKDLKKLAVQLAQGERYVKAGVLAENPSKVQRAGDKISNIELAIIHEFGSPAANIPERSFVRSSFALHREEYRVLLRKLAKIVLMRKMGVAQMLGLLGQRMAADMKNGITQGAGIPPPLKSATIAAKGSSRPLVDTGQLLSSITYVAGGGE